MAAILSSLSTGQEHPLRSLKSLYIRRTSQAIDNLDISTAEQLITPWPGDIYKVTQYHRLDCLHDFFTGILDEQHLSLFNQCFPNIRRLSLNVLSFPPAYRFRNLAATFTFPKLEELFISAQPVLCSLLTRITMPELHTLSLKLDYSRLPRDALAPEITDNFTRCDFPKLKALRFHSFSFEFADHLSFVLASFKILQCLDFLDCTLPSTSFQGLLGSSTILDSLERITLWKTDWSIEGLILYLTARRTALSETMVCGLPMVVSIQDSKASHSRSIENAEEHEVSAEEIEGHRDWEREQGLDMKNAKWISKAEAMGVRFTTETISTIKV
ncbi:hypothetical protein M422DRAFT_262381 [Sphaerobolus stellatus SS14]|uniref:F-box domain-containing protein n=1 Tax=Sphaerobolus stellatus (strain SS14) TaxID=990650 RepID=A0A0C9VDH6_SPHS4|nr:hypothetical protein M422DRAFT_262381 [Sphaerobolus stellatus SS14]